MNYVRSQYRIVRELSDWLKVRAKKHNRSRNGELNQILKEAKAREERAEQ